MPQYNRRELDVKAHEYGFNRDTFEKVLLILSILVDTFISKISFPMQPGPEIGSISDA